MRKLILLLGLICLVSSATAVMIGPFDEDHLFYREHKATNVLFCNHLPADGMWSISTKFNDVWQVDNGTPTIYPAWNERVMEFGNNLSDVAEVDFEKYFLQNLSIVEDNRCDECKVRWVSEHQPEESPT